MINLTKTDAEYEAEMIELRNSGLEQHAVNFRELSDNRKVYTMFNFENKELDDNDDSILLCEVVATNDSEVFENIRYIDVEGKRTPFASFPFQGLFDDNSPIGYWFNAKEDNREAESFFAIQYGDNLLKTNV